MPPRSFTIIATLLSATFAADVSLAATTLYRTVGPNGVPQYSDKPSPGAQKVTIDTESSSSPSSTSAGADYRRSAERRESPKEFRYDSCSIATPPSDQVFFSPDSVNAAISTVPGLQPGHSVFLTYDGSPVVGYGPTWTISPVLRGSHTLGGGVRDPDGRTVCTVSPVTFHVRQPSLLQPGRPKG